MAAILDAKGLDTIFLQARSHGRWGDDPLSDDMLRRIYDVAKFGPTSANCCPLRIVFVRSPKEKERLKPLLSPGNVDKTMAAPVTAIFAYDREFYEWLPRLYPDADFRTGYVKNPQRAESAGRFNAALQCAYFMIAARAFGVDCGPMLGFNPGKTDAAFFDGEKGGGEKGDGEKWHSLMLCNLGTGTDHDRQRNERPSFEEACRLV